MRVSQAVEALVREMGAQVQVNLRPLPAYTSADLLRKRAKVNAVANSTGGVEHVYPEATSADCCVVLDRPAGRSDRVRSMLRAVLGTGGLDDSGVAYVWAVNAHGLQAATLAEVRANRQTTIDAITASGSRYVLLVGKVATSIWRERVDFGWVTNHMYVMDSQWFVYPVYSPVAVMMDPMLSHEWRLGIHQFCEYVQMDAGTSALADRCSKNDCKGDVFLFDPDGAGWCNEHAEDGLRDRKNERVARRKNEHKQEQEGML